MEVVETAASWTDNEAGALISVWDQDKVRDRTMNATRTQSTKHVPLLL